MPKITSPKTAVKNRSSSKRSKSFGDGEGSGRTRVRGSWSRFQCHICEEAGKDRYLGQLADLERHINSIHKKADRYKCHWTGCSYANGQKANLKTHIRNKHSMLPVEVCTLGCGEAFYVLEDRDVHDTSKCALRSTPTVKARHLTAPRQKKPVLPAVTVRLPSPPSTPDTIELQLETKIKMKRKADDDILPTRTPVKKARIMARPATLKASTRKRKVPVIETPTIKRTMAVPSLPTPPPSVATQLRFTKGVREVSDNTLPLASLKPESSCSVSFFKRTHSTDYTCTSNSTAPRRQKPYDPVRERTPTEGEIEELEITVFSRQKPHSMVGWSDAQRRAVGPTTPPSSSVGLSVSLTKSHSIGDILRAAEIIEGTSSTN